MSRDDIASMHVACAVCCMLVSQRDGRYLRYNIISASLLSFAYIWVLCFDVRTENNQTAFIIIQPIRNCHFLRLLFIVDGCHFFHKI